MCAHAVRVALERLDGVEAVTVSLEEGVAAITLVEENEVTVSTVRRVVRDNGFSPKQTELRGVFETVALAGGEIGIKIGEDTYGLMLPPPTDAAEEHEVLPAGIRVAVRAVVPEPSEAGEMFIMVGEIHSL